MNESTTKELAHKRWPGNNGLAQWILDRFEPGYRGHAIDVGASDGISINSTWALEKSHGWTVLSVEANPEFADLLRKERIWVEMCACASEPEDAAEFYVHLGNFESYSSLHPTDRRDLYPAEGVRFKKTVVPVRTLDQLIAKWEFPKLDALCIDVEGTELDVLKGCDIAHWKPKVIVTECWDRVGPIDPYLENLGYKKTARSVDNDIFVLKDPA
jgi:FkbM family methyltransferase